MAIGPVHTAQTTDTFKQTISVLLRWYCLSKQQRTSTLNGQNETEAKTTRQKTMEDEENVEIEIEMKWKNEICCFIIIARARPRLCMRVSPFVISNNDNCLRSLFWCAYNVQPYTVHWRHLNSLYLYLFSNTNAIQRLIILRLLYTKRVKWFFGFLFTFLFDWNCFLVIIYYKLHAFHCRLFCRSSSSGWQRDRARVSTVVNM